MTKRFAITSFYIDFTTAKIFDSEADTEEQAKSMGIKFH